MIKTYPKIKKVKALLNKRLEVLFEGNVKKIYDCNRLIKKSAFQSLSNDVVFKNVRVDQGGYGISWSDEIDLSESELWLNGRKI